MKIRSYQMGGQRRRFREHVQGEAPYREGRVLAASHFDEAAELVYEVQGADGRMYQISLDRGDLKRIIADAAEGLDQHPSELQYGTVPKPAARLETMIRASGRVTYMPSCDQDW